MAGKLAAITGVTNGIGPHIARGLAAAEYDVVLIARNPERAAATRAEVAARTQNGVKIYVEIADLASIASVEKLAQRLSTQYPALSVLINNAGVLTTQKSLSTDGIELDLAVNHLAPFLLTWRLLPFLRQQRGTRVVMVNSTSHERAALDAADFASGVSFRMMKTYGKSKLANMAATVELAARIPADEVTINAVHPGVVATNLLNRGGVMELAWIVAKPFMLSPERGAQTPIWAATAPELTGKTGGYYKKKAAAAMNPRAQDATTRTLVWEHTLALARITEDLPPARR